MGEVQLTGVMYRAFSTRDIFFRLCIHHIGAPRVTMVYCCIVGCFNRSDRGPGCHRNLCPNQEGDHNVSFYRIPAIIQNQGKLELELSK